MRTFRSLGALLLALVTLSACGPSYENGPPSPEPGEIRALEQAILDLGGGIAEQEAAATARIAFTYPLDLAERYMITDPPLIHNMKVNAGRKPRGLCYQWADDLEARLEREGFTSLELHRAIANHDKPLRIEHSTVIVSRRGAPMEEGIVLDPWRWGGRLYWVRVPEDPKYDWWPRGEVFAWKRGQEGEMRGEIPAY
ncbi:hypothetical protein OCH239_01720 [Roseivivax halodurans JCM 10272]|uniref:Lipoprotein n=1 Tax=Roseivivax halodurans JCM 10272 TaxID=1449350 RepID=X7EN31_9RHOB|nr:hypothetical protein [Roseivivax halodurans]ETX16568.1 hypothetical protein OCH239_01720 [Roseivivax halodurans JCM 10272]